MGACMSSPRYEVNEDDNSGSKSRNKGVDKEIPVEKDNSETKEKDIKLEIKSPVSSNNSTRQTKWVLRKTTDIKEIYSFGKVLGKGNYGTVHFVTHKETGRNFACKVVNKKILEWKDSKDVRREIEILHLLSGDKNVVRLFEVYEDTASLHIVLEYCDGGDMFDYLKKTDWHTERSAADIIRSILKTVNYCHSMGVIHRDVKPENFMLSTGKTGPHLKLIDFGLSTFYKPGQKLRDVVGTAHYMAPEVLGRSYGPEADIWSVGIIMHVLLAGVAPFEGKNDLEVMYNIVNKPTNLRYSGFRKLSPGALRVLEMMLAKDPATRATAQELLQDPWLCGDGPGAAPPTQLPSVVLQRLSDFQGMNSFKKEARKVIAGMLNQEEVQGLLHHFRVLDKDADGQVSWKDLYEVMTNVYGVKVPKEEIRELLERTDLNGDGLIDESEFLGATMSLYAMQRHPSLLMRTFQGFDLDNSGFLTPDELRTALVKHRPKDDVDIEELMDEVDTNGDGRINYYEFCDMLRHNVGHVHAEDTSARRRHRIAAAAAVADAGFSARGSPQSAPQVLLHPQSLSGCTGVRMTSQSNVSIPGFSTGMSFSGPGGAGIGSGGCPVPRSLRVVAGGGQFAPAGLSDLVISSSPMGLGSPLVRHDRDRDRDRDMDYGTLMTSASELKLQCSSGLSVQQHRLVNMTSPAPPTARPWAGSMESLLGELAFPVGRLGSNHAYTTGRNSGVLAGSGGLGHVASAPAINSSFNLYSNSGGNGGTGYANFASPQQFLTSTGNNLTGGHAIVASSSGHLMSPTGGSPRSANMVSPSPTGMHHHPAFTRISYVTSTSGH